MRGRKYIVVIVLSWLIALSLAFALAFERSRMERAEIAHAQALAERGAEIFAQNCIVCHGVAGQGHVGPPLNVPGLKGDPREDTDLYEMLYNTIAHGRPGTSEPTWYMLENGSWASNTAMPAWSQEAGGTLNEQRLRAVVHFIMMGDWNSVNRHVPPGNLIVDESGRMDRDAMIARLPAGSGLSDAASVRGREIFVDRACIACHSIGGLGATVGPDLSKVGSWAANLTEDEWRAFLEAWISDPTQVENRLPGYWSNYGGPILDVSDLPQPSEPPPTQMPRLGLSEEEIHDLVTYLLSLR